MTESLITPLLQTLDTHSISQIASHVGESESSVSRGLESCTATVLGGMAAKSQDPGALRRVLDLLPGNLGDVSWSHLAGALTSTASPLIAAGNRMVSELFGSSSTTIASALGRQSGLGPGKASTLLAMAGPMVMNFLSRKMRAEGMNISGLASWLQRESSNIRGMLPAEVTEQLWPRKMAASGSPVVAQSVKRERRFPAWLPILAIIAAALGWLFTRRPTVTPTGTAERMVTETPCLSKLGPVNLHLPDNAVESQFMKFLRDPHARVDTNTWFDLDRLTFNSGSAVLRPESGQQLDDIAAIMSACPNVHIKIAGHTDSTGNPEANLKLSQARAESVKAALETRGISPDRMAVAGLAEQKPTAENSTMAGRAQNRRVSVQVTQK